jgi:hypothetical protein
VELRFTYLTLFHRHRQRVVVQLNQRTQVRADLVRALETGKARGLGFLLVRNIRALGIVLEVAIEADGK